MATSDPEILALLQQNDPRGYEILLEDYADLVYRAAYRILQNEQDAEDVTQETFLSVYRQVQNFRGDSKLSSWLHRIASNAAIDHLRAGQRKQGQETPLEDDPGEGEESPEPADENAPHPEESLLQQESLEDIRRALAEMPAKLRSAYLLYMVDGLSLPQVAETLNINLSAAKLRLHRARQFLTEYFSQR